MPDHLIESIKRFDVKPGEVLVLQLAAPVTNEAREHIYDQLREVIPNGVKYMLLAPGVEISVIAEAKVTPPPKPQDARRSVRATA